MTTPLDIRRSAARARAICGLPDRRLATVLHDICLPAAKPYSLAADLIEEAIYRLTRHPRFVEERSENKQPTENSTICARRRPASSTISNPQTGANR